MKLSAHFDSKEFRCRGPECHGVEPIVDQELVENLERWRALLNADVQPGQKEHILIITSGCRCPVWNSHEGGKPGSAHLYDPETGKAGMAADCYSPTRPVGEVYQAALQVVAFKGIGVAPANESHPGYVHVDVRPTRLRSQWGYNDSRLVVAIGDVLPRITPGAAGDRVV